MLAALPHLNDLAFPAMLSAEAKGFFGASLEDRERQRPDQLLAIGAGGDGNHVITDLEIDHVRDVRGNGHRPILPTEATAHPARPSSPSTSRTQICNGSNGQDSWLPERLIGCEGVTL